jgi:hypothetical protein
MFHVSVETKPGNPTSDCGDSFITGHFSSYNNLVHNYLERFVVVINCHRHGNGWLVFGMAGFALGSLKNASGSRKYTQEDVKITQGGDKYPQGQVTNHH